MTKAGKTCDEPSNVIPLGKLKIEDGFRFIGIDSNGGKHWCIVLNGQIFPSRYAHKSRKK